MVHRFELGIIFLPSRPPKIREKFATWGLDFQTFIDRHAQGDWGRIGEYGLGPLAEDTTRLRTILFLNAHANFGDEIIGLEYEDINFERGTVVNRSQNYTKKLLPAGIASLSEWVQKAAITSGPVFPGLDRLLVVELFKGISRKPSYMNSANIVLDRNFFGSEYVIELPTDQTNTHGLLTLFTRLGDPAESSEAQQTVVSFGEYANISLLPQSAKWAFPQTFLPRVSPEQSDETRSRPWWRFW